MHVSRLKLDTLNQVCISSYRYYNFTKKRLPNFIVAAASLKKEVRKLEGKCVLCVGMKCFLSIVFPRPISACPPPRPSLIRIPGNIRSLMVTDDIAGLKELGEFSVEGEKVKKLVFK